MDKFKIEIPITCPSCDSELKLVNEQLFCDNPSCPARSAKSILHYVKTMKIMGLGEKTLEKLNIDNISSLYSLDEENTKTILGEKIGTKILNEIEKSKKLTIGKFLSGMSIPLIGKTAAEKIQNTVTAIEDINRDTCKKAGLGTKATNNLMDWIDNKYYEYENLPIIFEESEPVESGLAVCVSGKVPGYTKAKIKEELLDYNVTVKDNVTKDLDFLISNESGTTKVKKAEQYNIEIISFDKFMEKIK